MTSTKRHIARSGSQTSRQKKGVQIGSAEPADSAGSSVTNAMSVKTRFSPARSAPSTSFCNLNLALTTPLE